MPLEEHPANETETKLAPFELERRYKMGDQVKTDDGALPASLATLLSPIGRFPARIAASEMVGRFDVQTYTATTEEN